MFVKRAHKLSDDERLDWCIKCNANHGLAGRDEFLEEQSRIEAPRSSAEEDETPSSSFGSSFGGGDGGISFGGGDSGGDSGGGFSGGGGDSGGGGASGGW